MLRRVCWRTMLTAMVGGASNDFTYRDGTVLPRDIRIDIVRHEPLLPLRGLGVGK